MNERFGSDDAPVNPPSLSAGALLRQARLSQGLHIAALATQLKVSPRMLEALESDRFEQLPDAAFARALAQSMCRQLRIDAASVLSRLPQPKSPRLEHVTRGLDTPFREPPGRHSADEPSLLTRPVVWGPALILIAAAVVYLLPAAWTERLAAPASPASAPAAATQPEAK
jgi:cytoskeleton protein RodZ